MKLSGAQIFLEMLKLYGVKHVFGVPGETTLALYKYWANEPEIEHILTHDERNAAFMAEAYAKVTGKVGISEAPSPGGTHPAPGVLESQYSAVPTICFTSDVPWNNDKRNMLSGFDQNGLYSAITKESLFVTKAEDLPFIIRRAFRVATADKPGAVHVKITMDVYKQEVEVNDLYADPCMARWPAWRPVADFQQIDMAVDLLAQAYKPVIICGKGVLDSGASEAVTKLAEMMQIPVGCTMTGKGGIAETHPLSIRVTGARGGTSYSNQFIKEADLIFLIGTNTDSASTDSWQLPDRKKQAKLIQLDISGIEAGNNYSLDAVLVGDAKATLEYMIEIIKRKHITPISTNASKIREAMEGVDSISKQALLSQMNPIHPLKVIKELDMLITPDTYVVVEPCIASVTALAFMVQKEHGRKFISNYSHGALGYTIPAALAVAIAHPEASIIGIDGDGSFHFSCGELETYARYNVNIKLIVFKNNCFGWIKGETSHVYHSQFFAADFGNVDYCKVAEGFNIKAVRIHNPSDVSDVLQKALSVKGPVIIEVTVPNESELVPPVPRWVPNAKEKDIPYFY